MTKPFVSSIRIYPIKGLDFIELKEAEAGFHSLLHDRSFAMLADDNKYINGKRTGLVNQIQAKYNLKESVVHLSKRGKENWESFELVESNQDLENYLSDFFRTKVKFVHSNKGELQDMPKLASVSVVSANTFKAIHEAFS